MNMLKARSFALSLLVLVLAAIVLIRSVAYVVSERELAVILQFGEPVRSIEEPGLYFKVPFIQEVRRFPSTLQLWTSDEDIVDLPTADGKKVEVAAWAVWRINDPLKFVQALRTVDNGQLAVKDRVRAAIRDEITSHQLAEVVRSTDRELTYSFRFELPDMETADGSDEAVPQPVQPGAKQQVQYGRAEIVQSITKSVRGRLEGTEQGEIDRGVKLVDVGLSNIGFVPAVREAAFERLRAFMDSIASGYTSSGEQRKQEIINRTEAEVEQILGNAEQKSNVIRGQADAEIIRNYASAIQETGDFYQFIKKLELYESSLSDRTRLILTTDSSLLRLLRELETAGDLPDATQPADQDTERNQSDDS